MAPLDPQQSAARDWFENLRDRNCAAFEAIEAEAGSDARLVYMPWEREDGEDGAGASLPACGLGGVRGDTA